MEHETADTRRLHAQLAAHRTGVLVYDQTPMPIQFVIDTTGALVCPVPQNVLDANEHIVCIPEETAEALQLLLSPELIDPDSLDTDKWRAYHGESRHPLWARFVIDSGKLNGCVCEHLMIPNTLGREEWTIGKAANTRKEDLIALLHTHAKLEAKDPLVVGVDQFGFDVRVRFGIVRIEFDHPAHDANDAAAMVDRLLAGQAPS